MIAIYLLAVLALAFAGWRVWRRGRYFLHIYQLEGYKPNQYRSWLKERWFKVGFRLSHKLALALLALAYAGFFYWNAFWTAIIVLPLWAITFASSRIYRSTNEKKPLAYTARLQRQLAATFVLAALWPVTGLVVAFTNLTGIFWLLVGFFLADFFAPQWVLLGGYLLLPVEGHIQEGFKDQARAKLAARDDLHIVGVTGSYGKTSTKFIIEEILEQKYSVLASPSSYNTPMGLCLVINEKLRPEHQMLVLEYGMRYRGDIQELCDIARPHTAVVTTVGVAHLETIGSIDNIEQEKGDLVEYMHPGGTSVLNAGDERVLRMKERASGPIWTVALEDEAIIDDVDLIAHDISYSTEGATFSITEDKNTEQFSTRLLGRHNVLNLLLGIAVGRSAGLRLRQMRHAVKRIEPVEHRLALRKEGNVTIIDDAFNSNPVGARNAVEILGQMDSGRRVIVTPGMIELGERQVKENRNLGVHIAEHNLDLAILVGEAQTAPIRQGLDDASFPDERVKTVGSLNDARDFLDTYLQSGDIVLFENDLPDQYDT